MTIRFTTTRRDILALVADAYLRSFWTYLLLGVFILVTLPSTLDVVDFAESGSLVGFLTVTTMEVILLAGLILLLSVVTAVNALVVGRKSLVERTMSFSAESLTEQTEDSSSIVAWRGVHRVRRTRNYIFVYVRPLAGYSIPRRAVAGPEEWSTLYSMITEWRAVAHA